MPRVMIREKDYMVHDFGRWFLAELRRKGLTQNDAAKWLGVTQQCISRKVKEGSFSIRDLITIFEKLGTNREEIGCLLKKR